MVGKTGLEPATPEPPAQCSTRLSYSPTVCAACSLLGMRRGPDYTHHTRPVQQKAIAIISKVKACHVTLNLMQEPCVQG